MKTTIEMARDALIVPFFLKATNDEHIVRLKDFEALARADEREALLDLVDDYAKNNTELKDAIRARGNT